MSRMRALLLFLILACTALDSPAQSQPLPIESFFKLPQYASMALSPDGKLIAALAPLGERQGLVVIDLDKRKAMPIASAPHMDVVQAFWVNSNRIVQVMFYGAMEKFLSKHIGPEAR
jgi:hypothetical protein